MSKVAASTILNTGSIATFIAFPLLYSASYGGGVFSLALGMFLVVFSMATPFIAKKRSETPGTGPERSGK